MPERVEDLQRLLQVAQRAVEAPPTGMRGYYLVVHLSEALPEGTVELRDAQGRVVGRVVNLAK